MAACCEVRFDEYHQNGRAMMYVADRDHFSSNQDFSVLVLLHAHDVPVTRRLQDHLQLRIVGLRWKSYFGHHPWRSVAENHR